ncbi:MAG: PHP domain-containing protein [Candidatus Eisenbacteria bacterium]|nr:PHP domain-containing protein [Candidatus Eisenbacteria bacterium]
MSPFGIKLLRPRPRPPEIDLHMHSTQSDGSVDPAGLVREALALGLKAISITDHDTTSAIVEARRSAEGTGLEIVPGVELSTAEGKSDVHLLIYGFSDSEGLEQALLRFREARERRAEEMVGKLNALGIEITMAEVRALAGPGAIGRPHLAQALVLMGAAETSQEVFRRWLGHGGSAWVPKERLTMEDAAEIARRHGGVTSLAHPATLRRDDLIPTLRDRGVQCLEVWHSRHDVECSKYYLALARRHGLVPTGGSDYHGAHNPGVTMGCTRVAAEVLEELRAAFPSTPPSISPSIP